MNNPSGQNTGRRNSTPATRRERNRPRLQIIALVLALGAPFGLHEALNAGLDTLAAVLFAVIALGMAVTAWVS
jgi:hypothetical protein